MAPVWRALGITESDGQAIYLDGRVWVIIETAEDGVVTSTLRADVTSTAWRAAWVSPACHWAYEPDWEQASPYEPVGGPITDPERDIDAITGWLRAQCERGAPPAIRPR